MSPVKFARSPSTDPSTALETLLDGLVEDAGQLVRGWPADRHVVVRVPLEAPEGHCEALEGILSRFKFLVTYVSPAPPT